MDMNDEMTWEKVAKETRRQIEKQNHDFAALETALAAAKETRDRYWCLAILNVLSTDHVQRVLEKFNEIRDKPLSEIVPDPKETDHD